LLFPVYPDLVSYLQFLRILWQKICQDRQLVEITKSETKSNDKNSNDKNRNMACKTLSSGVVLVIETFGFRICFEFLISNFEFPDKQEIKNSKARLVPARPS
jgi:hypothetical protein